MNHQTKTYFKILFFLALAFSFIKFTVNYLNKPQNNPQIIVEQKQELIKKTQPVIKEKKPLITPNGLQTGNNWRSK